MTCLRSTSRRLLLTLWLSTIAFSGRAELPAPLAVNPPLAELGKHLFYDPRLSGDSELACASCHQPEHGFANPQALSPAYTGMKGFRNAPTLINTAHRESWLHDGRIGTNLNDVTREMITESWLMNMDMRLMQERLKQLPEYHELFQQAGLGEPSNGGVRKAIPEFLKTLTSRNAAIDTGLLSEAARRGQRLFNGKANCNQCHHGPLFTDEQTHNLGVPEHPEIFTDPVRHLTYLSYARFMGVARPLQLRRDVGAHVRMHRADGSDLGSFKTPGLRELIHTPPYMHNGVFDSLSQVIEFYNQGGGKDPNKSPRLSPLHLTPQEKQDLQAFLHALSGDALTGEAFVAQTPDTEEYPVIEDWREQKN
ncbi:photosynthetic protein synthase I [Aestuariirhabdus sp. Z084]|uniref:cytochrome-c peroxidase n=1 Tax=Aestuariirhabdus haliotis TaxID=2918751 RepID=UPI00201B40F2|nr:cytochrome c peroxidase [Aestuariirhabdus haliotis]MCL6415175.1 photosynthetic protein synthase I [Aestuariirhabdus haliotis]MCL6420050.1 photosynthetic protein synthase I [Aestuariirhabdus haliotis]